MQKGKTYSDVAVYVPYEDAVMKGAYPKERQRVWVWGEYELRYVHPPQETTGYHPLWINRHFLENAELQNSKLRIGDAEFSTLYVNVEYMDVRALRRVLELAKKGLPVCMKHAPKQPGKNKSGDYESMLHELIQLKNVSENFHEVIDHPPLIQGDSIPDYWCRVDPDGTHYLFLAQFPAKNLEYPVYSGQSFMKSSDFQELTIKIQDKTIKQKFEFKPYQSLMLKITPKGEMEMVDITFVPKDPVVRPREKQRMNF